MPACRSARSRRCRAPRRSGWRRAGRPMRRVGGPSVRVGRVTSSWYGRVERRRRERARRRRRQADDEADATLAAEVLRRVALGRPGGRGVAVGERRAMPVRRSPSPCRRRGRTPATAAIADGPGGRRRRPAARPSLAGRPSTSGDAGRVGVTSSPRPQVEPQQAGHDGRGDRAGPTTTTRAGPTRGSSPSPVAPRRRGAGRSASVVATRRSRRRGAGHSASDPVVRRPARRPPLCRPTARLAGDAGRSAPGRDGVAAADGPEPRRGGSAGVPSTVGRRGWSSTASSAARSSAPVA